MVSTRLLLAAVLLASLGTACTAIVLGKVSDTDDYKVVPNGTSSSSGSGLDDCSLLKGDYSSLDRDANACATCIQNSCATDVAYACNGGKTAKPWFSKLKNCAQDPWNGFKPPSEPSGSYDCRAYEKPAEAVKDNGSDTELEPKAHNCVNTNCLQGATPPCKMCEVHIQKSSADPTEALLRDDPCGSCLADKCMPELVECCGERPVADFVAKCAFTNVSANKAACLELGNASPDGGPDTKYYDDGGVQCLTKISACFKRSNCAAQCQ